MSYNTNTEELKAKQVLLDSINSEIEALGFRVSHSAAGTTWSKKTQ